MNIEYGSEGGVRFGFAKATFCSDTEESIAPKCCNMPASLVMGKIGAGFICSVCGRSLSYYDVDGEECTLPDSGQNTE